LQSGVSFHEAQVAMARIWIGKDSSDKHREVVVLERPKDETGDPNQTGEKQKVSEGVKMPNSVEEVGDRVSRRVTIILTCVFRLSRLFEGSRPVLRGLTRMCE
jgi:hypothetical protein